MNGRVSNTEVDYWLHIRICINSMPSHSCSGHEGDVQTVQDSNLLARVCCQLWAKRKSDGPAPDWFKSQNGGSAWMFETGWKSQGGSMQALRQALETVWAKCRNPMMPLSPTLCSTKVELPWNKYIFQNLSEARPSGAAIWTFCLNENMQISFKGSLITVVNNKMHGHPPVGQRCLAWGVDSPCEATCLLGGQLWK